MNKVLILENTVMDTPQVEATAQDIGPEAPPHIPHDEWYQRPAHEPSDVIVFSRHVLNYFVIGVTCFVLGAVVAGVAISRLDARQQNQTNQIVQDVVAAVLAGQGQTGGGTTATSGSGGDTQNQRVSVSADDDPYIGAADAPLVIVEFSDFKCPYCGRFATTTLHPLLDEYGDYVRFVFRDFPILGDVSVAAALAGECAHEQDAFWQYHDLLYNNQSILGRDAFIQFATDLGLDTQRFIDCIDSEQYRDEVIADYIAAQDAGASGTPTFFINGRLVSGAQPITVFASVIEEELQAAGVEQSRPANESAS